MNSEALLTGQATYFAGSVADCLDFGGPPSPWELRRKCPDVLSRVVRQAANRGPV